MTLLLGLDVGTTAIKALLFDADARRSVAVGQEPTVIRYPGEGRSEFSPDQLWSGVVSAIRQVLAGREPKEVAALAVASMGEVGVPLDGDGLPCYPAISWFDRRSEEFLPWWNELVGVERVYQITGQVLHHMYGALKMQWLRRHEPDVWARTRRWLSVEDFIIWRLADVATTDYSVAGRTLLFDQANATWSEALLAATGIRRALLPEAVPSGTVVGRVSDAAMLATGLAAGTPVVTGGHDHLVGALAAGAARPGVVLDSAGTAEGILVTVPTYSPNSALFRAGFSTYRHVVPDNFVVVAGQHGAGGLVNWLLDRLYAPDANGRAYARALADAAAAPLGAGGLFCLPHLRGSRVPERDLRSRAAFVGLTDGHERGHLVRATLESLGYWLKESVDVLASAAELEVGQLVVIGGATRSPLWMQIKADCTGLPLTIPQVTEAVALGAALLAGVGAGVYADQAAAAAALPRPALTVLPDVAAVAQYAKARAVYRQLYPALRDINTSILSLAEGPNALTIV
ncbi:MAG TPA: FGGY family carbohydrate kinase [Chloroflexota bacterium]|nr:FGGY family carbohydrate kinase [Chloroflexota bacterium]